LGKDQLYGGVDLIGDEFVFTSRHDSVPGTNRDVIHNFTRGADDIDLRQIDARPSSDADNAFSWGGTLAGAYRVWWTATEGGVLLRADVSGNSDADFEVFVKGVDALGSGDVLL
jgi:hypothetical protein